jgi:eukaryotic-like serine/threonine-protein kinase
MDERLDVHVECFRDLLSHEEGRSELTPLESRDVVGREARSLRELHLRPSPLLPHSSDRLSDVLRERLRIELRLGCRRTAQLCATPRSLFHRVSLARDRTAGETRRTARKMKRAMGIDVGEVIAGKYELVRRLGRGAMGEVWVARHLTLGESVAIKFLSVTDPVDGDLVPLQQRFLFEAQAAAKLSRKTTQIVSVTDHGVDDGVAYLVMELLEGDTLEALVGRAGPRPLAEVVELVAQTAKGLAVAHAEGVLHRDLNSANLFVARDAAGRPIAKVLDFGIARSIRAPRWTARGMVLGSPDYMSPEQALGLANLDQRCDIWALSVVAYEALTGTLPFETDPPEKWLEQVQSGTYRPLRDHRSDLPSALEGFFGRAFAPQIEARFKTAAALADAFERAATELSLPSGRDRYAHRALEPLPLPPSEANRGRSLTLLATVMLGALVICVLAVVRAATVTAHASAKPDEATPTPAPSVQTVATIPSSDPREASPPIAPGSAPQDSPAFAPGSTPPSTPVRRATAPLRSSSSTPGSPPPSHASPSPPAAPADRDNIF